MSSPIFPPTNSNTNALFMSIYSQIQSQASDQNSTNQLDLISGQLKPQHSYIGLIAKAILSTKDKRMLLNEVYEWIAEEYPYFRFRGTGWRNSIRHNLSLNDCFVKEARAPNGKGHYWTIHPANLFDFSRGDFRRKHAQWRIKSHDVQAFALHNQNVQQFFTQMSQIKKPKTFNVSSLLEEKDEENS